MLRVGEGNAQAYQKVRLAAHSMFCWVIAAALGANLFSCAG